MLCGIPPFYDRNIDKMYEFIKHAQLRFPSKYKVSADAQDLIIKLLNRDPKQRLGSKGGLNDIKAHAFFQNMSFELVLQKKLPAPFIPVIQNKYDVQNFDEDFTTENPDVQTFIPEKSIELIKKNQDMFKEFK